MDIIFANGHNNVHCIMDIIFPIYTMDIIFCKDFIRVSSDNAKHLAMGLSHSRCSINGDLCYYFSSTSEDHLANCRWAIDVPYQEM